MVSFRAWAVTASLRARRSKKFYTDPHKMRERLSHHQNPRRTVPPRFVRRAVSVECAIIDRFACYLLAPKEEARRSPVRILHIHGGGFVEQPERHHWRFVTRIVQTTNATVVFSMYPMAPEYHHQAIQEMVRRTYDRFVGPSADEDRIVFGDSAGGGLALWLTAQLRAEKGPMPAALALSCRGSTSRPTTHSRWNSTGTTRNWVWRGYSWQAAGMRTTSRRSIRT
ncbi:alpha/beta hydrolase [Rhodococcus sp. NPDC058521]|uniref:alpha/beta hydrolase n=1 Tax=Rhodococcus sp. NPDC058521 TaxID=3346536 RepID=UPI00364C39F8